MVRELGRKLNFLEAGADLQDRLEASLLKHEIEATYLRWGLAGIEGLTIDGEPPVADRLIAQGPEALATEIITTIKSLCFLQEDERKN